MSNQKFKTAINLLLKKAPEDWSELQVRYQYFYGAIKIKTYSRVNDKQDWQPFNFGGFDLMDFFDDYRSKSHPKLDTPWSTLILTVHKDHSAKIEYEYGDPDILGG